MVIRAHRICGGKAEGEAVVYQGPFSFLGDLDPATGRICLPRHPLEGVSVAGKVFVFVTGKGSGGSDVALWAAKKKGNAPVGIVCAESEPVLSGGVIAAGIPTVDRPEINIFERIKTGDWVRIDATEGVIRIGGASR